MALLKSKAAFDWSVLFSVEFVTGQTVSHYRILSRLGAGGMGILYHAEDLRLGRQVALKFLPDHLDASPGALERFRREAQAASAINHSNICTLYDIGEHEGRPFLVMELLEGETLAQRLAHGRATAPELLDWTIQIAHALTAAHAKGIVHRDIKPSNVFLMAGGHVKVLDFGIAKLTKPRQSVQAGDAEATLTVFEEFETSPGFTLGTLAYMSPEQLRGEGVDCRTDVFSLGTVLYEMAAGRRPFQGSSPVVIAGAILNSDPTPPTTINTAVPPELDRIVRKALEKAPALRYQTAQEFALDLEAVQRGSVPDVPRSSPRHRLFATIAAAVLVLAAVAGAILWLRLGSGPPKSEPFLARSIAVIPFSDLSPNKDQGYFCDGMTEEIISTLSRIKALHVVGSTSSFALKRQARDIKTIGADLHVGTVLSGSIRKNGNQIRIVTHLVDTKDGYQIWSEAYDRELSDVFKVQEEISSSIANALQVTLTGNRAEPPGHQTASVQAYNAYLQGRHRWYDRSEAGFRTAAEYFEEAVRLDPQYALAYAGLSDVYVQLDGWELMRPREAMPKAREFAQKAIALDPTLAEPHISLGAIYLTFDWNSEATDREYSTGVRLDDSYITGHWWYGAYLDACGRHEAARRHLERALQLDPLSVPVLTDIAYQFYVRYGDLRRGLTLLRKAINLDPTTALTYRVESNTLALMGRRSEADAALERARKLDPESPALLSDIAQRDMNAGDRAGARGILDHLLAISRARYVPPFVVARVYFLLKDTGHATEYLEAAVEERSPRLGWYAVAAGASPNVEDYGSLLEPGFKALVRQVLAKHGY